MGELTAIADRYYRLLLIGAPPLRCELAAPSEWFGSPPPRLVAEDRSGATVGLDDLSQAQVRWARLAIALALRAHPRRRSDHHLVLVLDEPDSALHATAERHLVAGLKELADELGAMVVVTTHSREFLNDPGVALWHVHRDVRGFVTAEHLDSPLRAQIDGLGIEPADLLQLHRVILVVEGAHDELVLQTLMGGELDRARVLVVPMRGGKNMATVVDSKLLLEFSDAPIVAMLDNLRAESVAAWWAQVTALQPGDNDGYDDARRAHFDARSFAGRAPSTPTPGVSIGPAPRTSSLRSTCSNGPQRWAGRTSTSSHAGRTSRPVHAMRCNRTNCR